MHSWAAVSCAPGNPVHLTFPGMEQAIPRENRNGAVTLNVAN